MKKAKAVKNEAVDINDMDVPEYLSHVAKQAKRIADRDEDCVKVHSQFEDYLDKADKHLQQYLGKSNFAYIYDSMIDDYSDFDNVDRATNATIRIINILAENVSHEI